MNKTKIEWVKNPDGTQGYSWNPIKGLCPVGCWYCYARKIYKRFHLDPEPWIEIAELNEMAQAKITEKRIFVCSTFELFHPIIDSLLVPAVKPNGESGRAKARDVIFDVIQRRPDLTFIILTKLPERIDRPMPPNVWLGVTVESGNEWGRAKELCKYQEASVKFISFEPILGKPQLGDFRFTAGEFDWFIMGRLTGHGKVSDPERGTLKNILEIAHKYNRPVFMKNNLKDIWKGPLIQEFPKPWKRPR
jgi:protein gp37